MRPNSGCCSFVAAQKDESLDWACLVTCLIPLVSSERSEFRVNLPLAITEGAFACLLSSLSEQRGLSVEVQVSRGVSAGSEAEQLVRVALLLSLLRLRQLPRPLPPLQPQPHPRDRPGI